MSDDTVSHRLVAFVTSDAKRDDVQRSSGTASLLLKQLLRELKIPSEAQVRCLHQKAIEDELARVKDTS